MSRGKMKSMICDVSVVIVMLFIVSSFSVLAEGNNFYFNGSFEIVSDKESANRATHWSSDLIPNNWLVMEQAYNLDNYKFYLDDSTSRTGKYSVKIEGIGSFLPPYTMGLFMYFPWDNPDGPVQGDDLWEPGKEYTISMWFKVQSSMKVINDNNRLYIREGWYSKDQKKIGPIDTYLFLSDIADQGDEWVEYRYTFTAPEGAWRLSLHFRPNWGKNVTVWVDDISITQSSE